MKPEPTLQCGPELHCFDRRFTDINVYGAGSVKYGKTPQNIRGYEDIFYSADKTAVS